MARTTLTDTQRILLSTAAMRTDLRILPPPRSLNKNTVALALSLRPLLARGLISEVPAQREDAVWREGAEGGRIALVVTPAGMAAIGVAPVGERDPFPGAATGTAPRAAVPGRASLPYHPSLPASDASHGALSNATSHQGTVSSAVPRLPRAGSKMALLIAALDRPEGATIPDLMEATGWQAHSVRGAISGALKNKLRLTVVSELIDGRGRVYRLTGRAPASSGSGDAAKASDQPVLPVRASTVAAEESRTPLRAGDDVPGVAGEEDAAVAPECATARAPSCDAPLPLPPSLPSPLDNNTAPGAV